MSNIAVVKSVEYRMGDAFYPIKIQNASASYEVEREKTNYGYRYRHSLQFIVSVREDMPDEELRRVLRAGQFRYTDVNGSRKTLGTGFLPVQTEYEYRVEGKPGSFLGYRFTVEWESARKAPSESFM